MKPATTIVTCLLVVIAIGHLLRLIFRMDIMVNGMFVPVWVSAFGFIVPLVLAWLLWRENKSIGLG
jgi:uncharacterized membrane protein